MTEIEALPNRENRTVRKPNASLRAREYLTEAEMEKLIAAAKGNHYGLRDSVMLLVVYRHALRAQECCDLEWSAVDWSASELHIRRDKGGKPAVHPIRGDELRLLRKLQREANGGKFMFMTERGGPMTADALNKMVKRLGNEVLAELGHSQFQNRPQNRPLLVWFIMAILRNVTRRADQV